MHQLDQGAAGRFRMNEGYQVPSGAKAGFFVDELEPSSIKILEGRAEVGHPVGDVVNAGSAAGEETCDGAGTRSRLDEFDGSDESDVHALFR